MSATGDSTKNVRWLTTIPEKRALPCCELDLAQASTQAPKQLADVTPRTVVVGVESGLSKKLVETVAKSPLAVAQHPVELLFQKKRRSV